MKKLNVYFAKLKELSKKKESLSINTKPGFLDNSFISTDISNFDNHVIKGPNVIPFGSEAYNFFIYEYRQNRLCKDNFNNIILSKEYRKVLKK